MLQQVKDFVRRSRAGEFFEDFLANSQVCMYSSNGTEDWLEQFRVHLSQCTSMLQGPDRGVAVPCMELLFSLFAEALEPEGGVIFVPVRSGGWSPQLPWEPAIVAYLSALSETTSSDQVLAAVHRLEQQLPSSARVSALARTNGFA